MNTKLLILFSAVVICGGCATSQRQTAASPPVLLTTPEGERFVGHQLKSFDVSENTIGGSSEGWITIYHTDGVPFRLTGEVWLDGPPKNIPYPSDMPDGLGIFVRAKDGKHRYSLTPDRVLVKRRHHEGTLEKTITQVAAFQPPAHHHWIAFEVEADMDKIVFRVGEQTAVIKGPIDMDGDNQIALAKGSKIRNLQLTIPADSNRK